MLPDSYLFWGSIGIKCLLMVARWANFSLDCWDHWHRVFFFLLRRAYRHAVTSMCSQAYAPSMLFTGSMMEYCNFKHGTKLRSPVHWMPNFQCILHCCILDCGDLVAPFMFCSASPSPYTVYNSNLISFYRRQPTCGFKSSPWRSDHWPHVGFPPLVSCPIFLQFSIHPSFTCTKYLWALFDYFLSCLVGIFVHANSSCFCFCCIFWYVPLPLHVTGWL
jgi:hypothetical protein